MTQKYRFHRVNPTKLCGYTHLSFIPDKEPQIFWLYPYYNYGKLNHRELCKCAEERKIPHGNLWLIDFDGEMMVVTSKQKMNTILSTMREKARKAYLSDLKTRLKKAEKLLGKECLVKLCSSIINS